MKFWIAFASEDYNTTFRSKVLDAGEIFAGKSVGDAQSMVDSLAFWLQDRAAKKPEPQE